MKTRRLFLKSFSSVPLFFAFNQTGKANNTTKPILLNQCSIAGFQYYQGKEILSELKQNEPLVLAAEPDNQYDEFAVAIYYQTKKLGYIPRNENKSISRLLQAGVTLNARVYAVDMNNNSWNAVQVAVYMQV